MARFYRTHYASQRSVLVNGAVYAGIGAKLVVSVLRNAIARPLARHTVETFARAHDIWRITTRVMDENKQAMIEADTFDMDTMLVMFRELQTKQLRAAAEGVDGLSDEMRRFIEEAKAAGITRCPIRDVAEKASSCPVDFKTVSPADARKAVEQLLDGND